MNISVWQNALAMELTHRQGGQEHAYAGHFGVSPAPAAVASYPSINQSSLLMPIKKDLHKRS